MTRPNSGVLHPMREDRSAFEHVESPQNPWLLAAWLGFATPLTSPLTIRVCSWCPTAPQANALAKAQGFQITHGVCPRCFQALMARQLGETFMNQMPPGRDWPTRPIPVRPQSADQFIAGWKAFSGDLYAIGKASGFYDVPHTDPLFNHEQKLILMVSEIIEGLEGTRGAPWPGIPDDKLTHRPMLEVELADAVIRIMNYASHTGLDVAGAITEKAAYNSTRGYRHGGKRF